MKTASSYIAIGGRCADPGDPRNPYLLVVGIEWNEVSDGCADSFALAVAHREDGRASNPLFPDLKGWYVWRAWRDCCEAAEIEGATIHDLRHTYAVHAVRNGMPLTELMKRLGHSRMQHTWRYAKYAIDHHQQHRAALDSMGLDACNNSSNKPREALL